MAKKRYKIKDSVAITLFAISCYGTMAFLIIWNMAR